MKHHKSRTKIGLAALAFVVVVASVTAVALAQDGQSGGHKATPTETQSGVPEGPYVDFCPTSEQTEAHSKAYDFDYKPAVACGPNGAVTSPASAAEPSDPGAYDATAVDQRQRQELLDAKTTKPATPESPTIQGELPNGQSVTVDLFAPPKERTTLEDLAQDSYP